MKINWSVPNCRLSVRRSDPLHYSLHWFLPCWKGISSGLCGAIAGRFAANGGIESRLQWCSQTQGVLTRRRATSAAGGWGSAWWGGRRGRVTGHSQTTVLQPIRSQLYFIWEKTWGGQAGENVHKRVTYCSRIITHAWQTKMFQNATISLEFVSRQLHLHLHLRYVYETCKLASIKLHSVKISK